MKQDHRARRNDSGLRRCPVLEHCGMGRMNLDSAVEASHREHRAAEGEHGEVVGNALASSDALSGECLYPDCSIQTLCVLMPFLCALCDELPNLE
jgi:hypothetical protein